MHTRNRILIIVVITGLLFATQAGSAAPPPPSGVPEKFGDRSPGLSDSIVRALRIEEGKQGEDWALRKQALLEYVARVHAANESSLGEFKGGADDVSLAIERGKAAMVFHLLRKMAGDENFSRAAKELTGTAGAVSWDEVRHTFEKKTRADLGWFFAQWVGRKGLPDIRLENAAAKMTGSRFEVGFDLVQYGDVYTLEVPLHISLARGGIRTDVVKIDARSKHYVLSVDDEPSALAVDPDYDLPRRPTEEERPPLLAALFGDEKPVVVPPVTGREAYEPLISALKQRGGEERDANAVTDSVIRASTLAVMGSDNPVVSRLYGKAATGEGAVSLTAKKNPWNPDKAVVIVHARSAADARAFAAPALRYGDVGSVAFTTNETGPVVRTAVSQRGIEMELREPPAVIDVSTLKTLDDTIRDAENKKIVYVGEYHDQFAHHLVQLQVLKGLYRKDKKLAMGMEMFQRPFQKVLDQYIGGAIDERQFLKKSEYFKRWGYDYNLYKPLLDFARAEKIPVIALNVRNEIPDKVSKGGMDSLTAEEKKEIPPQLDFSDDEYRDRLRDIFNRHKGSAERNFDFFYQAQVLWDETMASSIDEFLKKEPDYRMVIVTGVGHLAYGSGIPKRSFRRNGLPYTIILNDGDVDRDIANYLIKPQPLEGTPSPRLMAIFGVRNNRVVVVNMPPDSVAKKAGIKVGDAILSLDGTKIESIEDLKLELFFRKKDDTVKVTVLRKRFLFGDREMEFDVKL
jgi:aminopeptidase N